MDEFIHLFIEDAVKTCDELEQLLLALNHEQTDEAAVNDIFRGLHSLKGASAMYGYSQTEHVTHKLESVFDSYRDAPRPVVKELISFTLTSVDLVRTLVENKDKADGLERFNQDILAYLAEGDSVVAEVSNDVEKASGEQVFVVFFMPDEQVMNRGVNPLSILEELDELGSVLTFQHNRGETSFEEQLAAKKIETSFEVLLKTKEDEEEVEDVFMFMQEEEYQVFSIGDTFSAYPTEVIDFFNTQKFELPNEEKYQQIVAFIAQESTIAQEEESTEEVVVAQNSAIEQEAVAVTKDGGMTISVPIEKLDKLMNQASQLVNFKAELKYYASKLQDKNLIEFVERLGNVSDQIKDTAFSARLVPVNLLKQRIDRQVRDLSVELGKEVNFMTQGMETELDRSIIKALENPIMHIVRNAMDHGIEHPSEREAVGKPRIALLKFSSFYLGSNVVIQIQDDGRGIDLAKIRKKAIEKGWIAPSEEVSEEALLEMILMPGFTTKDEVSNLSGRGVGMDVVKKEVSKVRGKIEINTEDGLGTIFTLKLPLSLSIIDTLVVKVGTQKYLVPVSDIEVCYKETKEKLFQKKSHQLQYKDQLIPFYYLRKCFDLTDSEEEEATVMVINNQDRVYAAVVDKVLDKHQAVYRPLSEIINYKNYFSGASTLGDGDLALIIDTNKLIA